MNDKKISMPSYDDSKVIGFGFATIITVFFIIGGWMAYAPLATSAVSVGRVSADMNKKTVQHLEGGKVDAIYVKDGDFVKKGDMLLKLSEVQVRAQLDILKPQYQESLAMFDRLKAQRDDKETIEFDKELTDKNAMRDQRNIFESTKKKMDDERIITKNKISQLENQIKGLESLARSKEVRLKSINEEISEWEQLFEQRLVDKQRIRELKREASLIEGDIANTSSEVSRLKEQISELDTQQQLREKEFKNETLQRYVEVKSSLSDLRSKIIANEDVLARTSIVSPIDGVVVGMNMHTIGGVVSPGEPILEIISQDSGLYVVAQVQTADIDKVHKGLLADIRFSAFDLKNTHVIEGKVIHVSADSFIDKASNMPYYEAKIEVTEKGMQDLKGYGFELLPGMPAEVMIKTGERTMLSYLVKPFTDMLSRSFNEE